MEWRSKVLGLLAGLGCWIAPPVWAQTNLQPELRGVWLTNVDSDVLFSRERLRQALARLQRLRFNTLYPVVYNGGYTLFPSATMAKYAGVSVDPNPAFQGRDMLQEAIAEGRARQMAVIPWLEYGLMAPEDSELVKRNPTWVTRRQDGSALVTLGANNEVRLVRLNPAHPEVRQFLLELVQEIVQKYEVDGIQFDDHFGWPVDMGYDEFTVALYQQEHNGKAPPSAVRDPEWMRWRARFLTDLWVSIFAKVRFHRPNAVVSLSPNPRLFSYQAYLQDWYRWARLGLIDELIVQVYRDNLGTYATELTAPELHDLRAKFPVAVGVLTGLRIRNVDMGLISDQVQLSRLFGLDGFSYFFYETLGARDGGFQTLHGEQRPRPRRK
ncbi:MAG TPA: hypothetical protein DCQ32_06685 [Cyanobacteria bacterium UBA8156]|nr:hypothetical protein [Cyanobacteria bacterium UBA8156]